MNLQEFGSIREVMAKANDKKSGDELAGIAAETATERMRAKRVLSELTVHDLFECPAVPYEDDEVTRIIIDDIDKAEYEKIKNWTMAELREWLLADSTTGDDMLRGHDQRGHCRGLQTHGQHGPHVRLVQNAY